MAKLPGFMMFPGDWLRDSVSGCSLAAQALWLRMMFIGHDSDRYGHLSQDGKPIPPESIAQRCGSTLDQYLSLLAELDAAGVCSRTSHGILYSRRMVRDQEKRELAAERQRRFKKTKKVGNASVTHQSRASNTLARPRAENENLLVVNSNSNRKGSAEGKPKTRMKETLFSQSSLAKWDAFRAALSDWPEEKARYYYDLFREKEDLHPGKYKYGKWEAAARSWDRKDPDQWKGKSSKGSREIDEFLRRAE